MIDYVYQYRLSGETHQRLIRAPNDSEQQAVHDALQAQHGHSLDYLLPLRSATLADAQIACIGGELPATEIAASWDAVIQRVFG